MEEASNSREAVSPAAEAVRCGLYAPLNPARLEIRLLKVFKEEGSMQLPQLSLVIVSLDDTNLDYSCLSYQWALEIRDDEKCNNILSIDGHNHTMSDNLAVFMNTIVTRDSVDMHIWIDSICVNQEDNEEKSTQVSQMHKIYERATRVFAWLGPTRDDSSRAMAYIRAYAKLANRKDWRKALKLLADTTYEADRIALLHLLQRPYWERGWIVQEICSNTKVWITCDSSSDLLFVDLAFLLIDLTVLTSNHPFDLRSAKRRSQLFWSFLMYSSTLSFRLRSHLYTKAIGREKNKSARDFATLLQANAPLPTQISRQWISRQSCEEEYLFETQIRFRNSVTGMKHDKVYTLWNLSSPYNCIKPRLDYDQPWQEVFKQAASYILHGSQSLDLLICAGLEINPSSLPSWVPDWTKPVMDFPMQKHDMWVILSSVGLTSGEIDISSMSDTGCGFVNGDRLTNQINISGSYLTFNAKHMATVDAIYVRPIHLSEEASASEKFGSLMQFVMSEYGHLRISYQQLLYEAFTVELARATSSTSGWKPRSWVGEFYDRFSSFARQQDQKIVLSEEQLSFLDQGLFNNRTLFKIKLRESVQTTFNVVSMLKAKLISLYTTEHESASVDAQACNTTEVKESLYKDFADEVLLRQTVGLCRAPVRTGDEIFAVPGCTLPLIFRPIEDLPGHYINVGGAYVNELMNGDAFRTNDGLSAVTLH